MGDVSGILFPLVFAAFFAFVLWSAFSRKGKGRMLGGSIETTAAHQVSRADGLVKTTIRAHTIVANDGSRHVGLELSRNAKLGFQVTPIKLTRQEAETLIHMLREVTNQV